MPKKIRNIIAWCYAWLLIVTGRLRRIKTRAAKGEILLSVYFHDPDQSLFENCIKWFLKNGFTFISADELSAIISSQSPLPASSVIFTVDDGWKNNKKNIIEVAEKYKIPVTLFISTQPVESGERYWWSYVSIHNNSGKNTIELNKLKSIRTTERESIIDELKINTDAEREALTVEDIKQHCSRPGISFECHTHTHPILTQCEDERAFEEVRMAKEKLEEWTDKKIRHFAYPNGCYGAREISILKTLGFESAFTTNPDYLYNNQPVSVFEIPRFDVLENVSFTENICRMTGAWFERKKSVTS